MAATPTPETSRAPQSGPADAGPSRRSALKHGAIIAAGAVWVPPAVQLVTMPAAAAASLPPEEVLGSRQTTTTPPPAATAAGARPGAGTEVLGNRLPRTGASDAVTGTAVAGAAAVAAGTAAVVVARRKAAAAGSTADDADPADRT